ncbi:MAG: nucleotidyltransferase substrate binding protein [Deltaproteobacteria bacterium]|nr:nucleotidyltransferase substrate binding protein [Deltaproteobacteria bacterium]
MTEQKKLPESIKALEHALTFLKLAQKDPFYFAGISKTFETCLEYAWKYLKQRSTEEGLEAYSPREAIKIGGRLGLIDNVEKWLDFLEDRNLAVHDYLGIADEDYLKTIQDFVTEVKKLPQPK